MNQRFRSWLRTRPRALRRIAVLTGAGISAESGIPTFRGQHALWEGRDPSELFTPDALFADPSRIWRMYDALRVGAASAAPNAGHLALAALEQQRELALITQNIDGLHQRAGSVVVHELHGTLWRLRCTSCRFFEDDLRAPLPSLPPYCPHCNALLRPDIVLYTEPLPAGPISAAMRAATTCDLLLVVGTSGVVYPAAGLPELARAHGAALVEINPRDTALTGVMDHVIRATAAAALPWVVEELLQA